MSPAGLGVLQLRLQRELFDPLGEQVLALVQCAPPAAEKKGKRRDYHLCLVNKESQIFLTELRSGGDDEVPKKKRSWPLKELSSVDGRGENDSSFSLQFGGDDKTVFTWIPANSDEKKKFLSTLINLSARHGGSSGRKKVMLVNLPNDVIVFEEEAVAAGGNSQDVWPILNKEDSYEPISGKEAADLMALMQKCEHAVTHADTFVEDLGRELNVLDGANIYSIMASEENIGNLMEMLEGAIQHVESIESRLNQYDDLLEHIRDSMDKMEGKTVSIETVNLNNKKLLETLEDVLKQMDLSYKHQSVLQEADFSNPKKLRECVLAAKSLQKVLNATINPNLAKMTAVQDQQKKCEKLKEKFAKAIFRHLNNLFVHLGNDTESLDGNQQQELRLKRRKTIHKELMKFAELVHWTKDMDVQSFAALQATYRGNLSKLYEKDIHRFFEMARFRISGGRAVQPPPGGSTMDLSGTSASGAKKGSRAVVAVNGLIGTDADSVSSEVSISEREKFDDIMETLLVELEDICMDEQYFSSNFFQMEQIDVNNPDQKEVKRVTEEARSMMAEIFPSLESELLHFISFYERTDSFFTMHALVRLGKHVLSAQNTGSFLAISFGTVLVQIKRNFDKFMQLQVKSVEETRAPKKQKCGILTFISNFEGFISTTEGIFRVSERRSDLEKWYTMLVAEMCSSVVRISRDHGKTPAEVIKMENFHHLHALLSQMKIASLEQQKKEIKQRYADALSTYVTQYFGRPLEKLNVFFEGIQQLVAAGIKESEISYQLAYSKQELRKVIAIYPGREVRRGLDSLYKKVERHLCDEESLNQVVWRAMQEEFIRQYKNIEDLVQRCYPGAQISLDFTINEILEYFSDIARSH